MGMIVRGKCPGCGYEVEVKTGGGQWDWKREAIENAAPEGTGLEAAMEQGASLTIERCLATCGNCKKIVTGTYVCVRRPGSDEIQRLTKGCPDCGGTLRRHSPDARAVGCPRCTHIIELRPAGHWD